LRLVRGDSVIWEDFSAAGAIGKVRCKDFICGDQTPGQPAAGFMTMEAGSFTREVKCGQWCCILEGSLTCTVNGKPYQGYAGDVLFIPGNMEVTFSSPAQGRWFFVNAPARS
jgi:ethanolamine utilization protein EutQ (cupin superfamily)